MRLSGRCGILIKIYSSLASQTEDNNMANNNGSNNNNSGGKNGKGNFRGVLTLIAWALVLTVAFNYFNAYNRNAANKTSSHEIKYSEMVTMIEKNQVDEVLFKDSTIYITPVDGYVYTEEVTSGSKTETKTYTQSKDSGLTLYTVYLSNADLLPLLEAHNVAYTGFYKAEMSPFLMIMIQYILPTIFIVGAFMLVMRLMSKSGGGGFGGQSCGHQAQQHDQRQQQCDHSFHVIHSSLVLNSHALHSL